MSALKFTNPFMRPVRYDGGPKYGFVLFPHSETTPTGWGDPTVDKDGKPIEPGTVGGPNPNRLLAYRNDQWRSYRKPRYQVAGPIDWKGPLTVPDNPTSKRYVLSYWGPNSRHFNFGNFEYGSDDKHREIYLNGKLLAIAPLPVLGAAIRLFTYPKMVDGVMSEVEEKWLVAILKDGSSDSVWTRPLPVAKNYWSVTAQDRYDMVQPKTDALPDGWQNIGSLPAQANARAPETPWFFNESATKAVALRRTEKTFDDGSGSNVTEDVFIQYSVTVSMTEQYKNSVFSVAALETDCRFDYSEQTEKYRETWVYQTTHDWQEDIYEGVVYIAGQMLIAAEYKGDELMKAYWDQSAYRAMWQYWSLGIDDPGEPSSNAGRTDGEWVNRTAYSKIYTNMILPGQHRTQQWMSSEEYVKLRIVNTVSAKTELDYYLQYTRGGTKSLFESGQDSNSDNQLYFWESIVVYLHHLDLRVPYLVGGADAVSNFYATTSGGRSSTVERTQWMQPGAGATDPYANAQSYPFFNRYSQFSTGVSLPADTQWDRTEMLTWPTTVSQSLTRLTYKGGWLDPNAGEALYTPYFWAMYDNTFYTSNGVTWEMRIWPIEHMLGGEKAYLPNGAYGVDEGGHYLAHFEYEDPQSGGTGIAYGLVPDGDMITAMTYGDRFSPGGVL